MPAGWAAIIGLNIFLPMYLQTVIGLSPTSAGLSLMVLMMSLNSAAGLGGQALGTREALQDPANSDAGDLDRRAHDPVAAGGHA